MNRNLLWIKLLHTLIWLFYNGVLFYLYYALLANRIDYRIWLCLGLILLEGMILLVFKGSCPLTLVARRYSDSKRDNFDIFLPNWLARHNKTIYTGIFLIALVLLAWRLLYE